MPDFLQTILGGAVLALLGFPYVVATRYPEKFPVFDQAIRSALSWFLVGAVCLKLGYDAGRKDQLSGTSITSEQSATIILVAIFGWAAVHAYILFLRFGVAEWAKEARDKENG